MEVGGEVGAGWVGLGWGWDWGWGGVRDGSGDRAKDDSWIGTGARNRIRMDRIGLEKEMGWDGTGDGVWMGPGMGWEWGWNKSRNGVGVKIGPGLSGKRIGMRLEWGQEQGGSGDRVGVLLSPCLGPPTLFGEPRGVLCSPQQREQETPPEHSR